MTESEAAMAPRVLAGQRPETDQRVLAVMDVLAGEPASIVARRHEVDVALLRRWVNGFVEAGSAKVTNRPDTDDTRTRDRFLAAFAHELRTPLTIAQGWADVLASDELHPVAVQRSLGSLRTALHRLSERTRDMELLATSALGLMSIRPALVRVGDLAESIGHDGIVGGAGPGVVIDVDPDHMRRVLRDLWSAAEVRPAPSSVGLEVHVRERWVELAVVRAGDPVPPSTLQTLFEPFDLNDDATGVTIGLYLARALVVAHGGTLGVDQDEVGARFWVRVPRDRPVGSARVLPLGPPLRREDPGTPGTPESTVHDTHHQDTPGRDTPDSTIHEEALMTFKLACGDVMPGCTARFENPDKGAMMADVAAHAADAHGISEITPEVASAVESKIHVVA